MRDIKYKCWDTINKRWINLWKFYFAPNGTLMAVEDIDGEIYGLHQVETIQYTGLNDKNGQEICEGDIVKANCGIDELFTCQWDNIFASFDFIGRYESKLGDYADCEIGGAAYPTIEVIGNIYENSELME